MALKAWTLTPWVMAGNGTWKQQPVILVEGQQPFFANHPDAYIEKLEALHGNPLVERGSFFTYIGQFKDAKELAWNKEAAHEQESPHRNGHRARGERH